MKQTRGNLQYDWAGLLSELDDSDSEKAREILNAVVYEVDCFRNQAWWRRLFNMMPPHWIDKWLKKEPESYFWKPIWHGVKNRIKNGT